MRYVPAMEAGQRILQRTLWELYRASIALSRIARGKKPVGVKSIPTCRDVRQCSELLLKIAETVSGSIGKYGRADEEALEETNEEVEQYLANLKRRIANAE